MLSCFLAYLDIFSSPESVVRNNRDSCQCTSRQPAEIRDPYLACPRWPSFRNTLYRNVSPNYRLHIHTHTHTHTHTETHKGACTYPVADVVYNCIVPHFTSGFRPAQFLPRCRFFLNPLSGKARRAAPRGFRPGFLLFTHGTLIKKEGVKFLRNERRGFFN